MRTQITYNNKYCYALKKKEEKQKFKEKECNKIMGKSDCNELPMQLFQLIYIHSTLLAFHLVNSSALHITQCVYIYMSCMCEW